MKPSSLDEQIEKLEKSILDAEKTINNGVKESEKNKETDDKTSKEESKLNPQMVIGVLAPLAIGGGLYYMKPSIILEKKKDKKKINQMKLLQYTVGATAVIWIGLYMMSKKE